MTGGLHRIWKNTPYFTMNGARHLITGTPPPSPTCAENPLLENSEEQSLATEIENLLAAVSPIWGDFFC